MKKKKRAQHLGFKFHGVFIERNKQRYQVVHKLGDVTYAVEVDSKDRPGGPVERFYN